MATSFKIHKNPAISSIIICTIINLSLLVVIDCTNKDVQPKVQLQLKTAEQYITAEGTEYRLSKLGDLEFNELIQPDEHFPAIMLDPGKTFQVIEGSGGFEICLGYCYSLVYRRSFCV